MGLEVLFSITLLSAGLAVLGFAQMITTAGIFRKIGKSNEEFRASGNRLKIIAIVISILISTTIGIYFIGYCLFDALVLSWIGAGIDLARFVTLGAILIVTIGCGYSTFGFVQFVEARTNE